MVRPANPGSIYHMTKTLDQLMFETDAPYLSPEPVRKMRPNEPKHVVHVARRLAELFREAIGRGARFVVFPELALTTFFPRYWMEDQAEVDRRFFEPTMPNPVVQPLFDLAKRHGVGFYLGYAELTQEAERTRRFNTAILVGPDG